MGMTVEEASEPPFEVWPDNVEAVNVFVAMGSQWRAGVNGATGLDYGALPEVWRRVRVPPARRDEVFDDLRTLEDAALSFMRMQRERKARK
jgi:hypothetical protein